MIEHKIKGKEAVALGDDILTKARDTLEILKDFEKLNFEYSREERRLIFLLQICKSGHRLAAPKCHYYARGSLKNAFIVFFFHWH